MGWRSGTTERLCMHVQRIANWMMLRSLFSWDGSFEPTHEIMILFVLHKLILQKHMRSHPVGLDVWFLVGLFIYFHTSCVRTTKSLARLHGCAGSPEPSLVAFVISTIISWDGSFLCYRGSHPSRSGNAETVQLFTCTSWGHSVRKGENSRNMYIIDTLIT